MVRFAPLLVAAALLLPRPVPAASEYARCVQEEQTLRAQEKERCSGLSYLLNPSGCFAAQKALRAFDAGSCPGIIAAGDVPPAPPAAQTPPTAAGKEAEAGEACSRLRAENERLRAEMERLRREIEACENDAPH